MVGILENVALGAGVIFGIAFVIAIVAATADKFFEMEWGAIVAGLAAVVAGEALILWLLLTVPLVLMQATAGQSSFMQAFR